MLGADFALAGEHGCGMEDASSTSKSPMLANNASCNSMLRVNVTHDMFVKEEAPDKFVCDVCGQVWLNGLTKAADHVIGRKHKRNVLWYKKGLPRVEG